jgi:integrase
VRRGDASTWLATEQVAISAGAWIAPPLRGLAPEVDPRETMTFGPYADTWLIGRRKRNGDPLAERTRQDYGVILDNHLRPAFGDRTIRSITRLDVRQWYATLLPDAPTLRAHTYALLRTILNTAVDDEILNSNPCQIKGAGSTKRKRAITVLKEDEYTVLVKAMPERLRAMVVLATWTALRFGELAELRRADVDIDDDETHGVLRVRRGVTTTKGRRNIGKPKSDAGVRDVTIPPHVVPVVAQHLREHVGAHTTSLLFPAPRGSGLNNLSPTTLYASYHPARDAVGRPDLRFHDLRHTGAVLAARSGATMADLMARLGHSTPGAAMRYQHTSLERDRELAARMSERASGF